MRLIQRCLTALVLCGAAFAATAAVTDPKNGAEYTTLAQPQNTDAGKKVEVIEFFAYYCPHCNAFDPLLAAWVKKQGDNIVFKRVHVPRDESVLPQQRLYYTLEALGLTEQYHSKVFDAMHGDQRLHLSTDRQVFDWAEKNGIDRAKFMQAYASFGVQAKVRRADAMVEAYHIDFWPQVAIDGKYVTSPSQVGEADKTLTTEIQQQQGSLRVMDYLVAKAKAEKK